MKYINITDENFDFEGYFNSVLQRFNIKVNKEYQFVYDEFLEHLINDTNKFVKKNFDDSKNDNMKYYTLEIFKKCFIDHWKSKDIGKLINPENYPEFKRKVRTDKLNKINGSK